MSLEAKRLELKDLLVRWLSWALYGSAGDTATPDERRAWAIKSPEKRAESKLPKVIEQIQAMVGENMCAEEEISKLLLGLLYGEREFRPAMVKDGREIFPAIMAKGITGGIDHKEIERVADTILGFKEKTAEKPPMPIDAVAQVMEVS